MDLSFFLFSSPERMLSLEEKRSLNFNFSFLRTFLLFLPPFYHSKHFITKQPFGETKKPFTLTEGKLGLTHRKPNFPPTGTHPSPRSASVWRSTTRSILLSLTSRRTPCTLWSLMGNIAAPHWVVTSGCHWLVLMPHCSWTVKRKGSTQSVPWVAVPKQESVFSATIKQIAMNVTPDWGLGVKGTTMIGGIHVEIWITTKEKDWASRQWGISWCSDNNAPLHVFERVVGICYTRSI